MQILLANAKIMFGKTDRKPLSTPLFQTTADMLAAEMAKMNMEDLARQLDCSKKDCHGKLDTLPELRGCRKDASPACLQWSGI